MISDPLPPTQYNLQNNEVPPEKKTKKVTFKDPYIETPPFLPTKQGLTSEQINRQSQEKNKKSLIKKFYELKNQDPKSKEEKIVQNEQNKRYCKAFFCCIFTSLSITAIMT